MLFFIIFCYKNMKQYLAILSLLCLIGFINAQTDEVPQENAFPDFDEYIKLYEKKYDEQEYGYRKELYYQRIKILDEIKGFRPGINKYSDWNEKQIAQLSGLLLLKEEDPDSNLKSEKVSGSYLGAPSSVDWRTSNAVTSVKDQQSCGSCWAFAAVAYAQSKIIVDGRYTDSVDLSEQRLLQCTQSSSCSGGYLQYAMNEVVDMIPFEFQYEYNYSNVYGGNICTAPAVRIGNTTQNYYGLSVNQLQQLVAQRPIAISLSADGWVNYGSGVFSCASNVNINHGVLLVGYTTDYWIIKNSWGSGWGDNGYININKTLGSNCKIGNSAHRTFQFHIGNIVFLITLIASCLLI